MPSHARRLVLGVAAVLIPMAAVTAAPAAAAGPASAVVASATPADRPRPSPTTRSSRRTRTSTECVSANPQPGCGSKAHGGWRQTLTFVVVALAMAFIGWRIVVIVRRNRKAVEAAAGRGAAAQWTALSSAPAATS